MKIALVILGVIALIVLAVETVGTHIGRREAEKTSKLSPGELWVKQKASRKKNI